MQQVCASLHPPKDCHTHRVHTACMHCVPGARLEGGGPALEAVFRIPVVQVEVGAQVLVHPACVFQLRAGGRGGGGWHVNLSHCNVCSHQRRHHKQLPIGSSATCHFGMPASFQYQHLHGGGLGDCTSLGSPIGCNLLPWHAAVSLPPGSHLRCSYLPRANRPTR